MPGHPSDCCNPWRSNAGSESAQLARRQIWAALDNDACVEVADSLPRVHVRDTKDHTRGELTATPAAWAAFTAFAGAHAV
ncbi:DUF397 domain-containing protein [Streptomyces sp. NPDC057271]|uniref:DUF397 domain-containing protein n=1 Tax=unclassified Streptomyces TaxID=2593676 RepID=UPI003639BD64